MPQPRHVRRFVLRRAWGGLDLPEKNRKTACRTFAIRGDRPCSFGHGFLASASGLRGAAVRARRIPVCALELAASGAASGAACGCIYFPGKGA